MKNLWCAKELLDIFDAFEYVQAGTVDKVQVITQVIAQSAICKKIFLYASDPMMKFQITSLPKPNSQSNIHCDWDSLFTVLDALIKARGASQDTKMSVSNIVGPCPYCRDIVNRILKKKLRIGLGAKSLIKCGLEIGLPQVQLAEKDLFKFNSKRRFFESRKLNGVRIIFKNIGGSMFFKSRTNHTFPILSQLYDKRLLTLPENEELDGEFMSTHGKEDALSICRRDEFQEPIGDILARTSINVFDHRTLGLQFDLDTRIQTLRVYEERIFKHLMFENNQLINFIPHDCYETKTDEEFDRLVLKLMNEKVKLNYEGIVIKNPYAKYKSGRTYDWVKVKPFDHIDLPVVGIKIGTEGLTKNVVSKLIVDFNGVEVGVGSGLDAQQRIDWLDPNKRPKLIEVKYQSITQKNGKSHSLEFPILSDKNDKLIFIETRDDH